MILKLNLVLLTWMVVVCSLPLGNARAMPPSEVKLPQTRNLAKSKAEPVKIISPNPTILRHVVREKRDALVPFSFETSHLPCDLDLGAVKKIVTIFPTHCVWAFNNRFAEERSYRIFKTYQLEAFMFGQYHERLRRFEMDPHTWDYASVIT